MYIIGLELCPDLAITHSHALPGPYHVPSLPEKGPSCDSLTAHWLAKQRQNTEGISFFITSPGRARKLVGRLLQAFVPT